MFSNILIFSNKRNKIDPSYGPTYSNPEPTYPSYNSNYPKYIPTSPHHPSVDPTYRPSLIPTRRTYNTVKPVTVSPSGSGTLVTTLVADEQFSSLVAALQAANITEETLADLAPLTLFAPTNEAFAKIDNETLNGLLTSEDKSGLTNILLRHVVPGQAVRLPEGNQSSPV